MSHVIIRADASRMIGTGHIYRCMILADALIQQAHDVTFICRELDGHLIDMLTRRDIPCIVLPKRTSSPGNHCAHADWLESSYEDEITDCLRTIQDYVQRHDIDGLDWLIADHYALDIQWHTAMRPLTKNMFQIDDLADREMACDLILNSSWISDERPPYKDGTAELLLGPSYALLSPGFSKAAATLSLYNERLSKGQVMIFFGGIDAGNETLKALHGVTPVLNSFGMSALVILGANNLNHQTVQMFCANHPNLDVAIQVSDMPQRMADCCLFIGAAGAITWERCAMGLPALAVIMADNQALAANTLEAMAIHHCIGRQESTTADTYAAALKDLLANRDTLNRLSQASMKLVDGKGLERLITHMNQMQTG